MSNTDLVKAKQLEILEKYGLVSLLGGVGGGGAESRINPGSLKAP